MDVSIIVPTYNRKDTIKECIRCIYNSKTKTKFEVIIINDGSTDNTPAILNKIAEKHKNLTIIQQSNSGAGEARNKGIEIAKGKICLLIGDDIYLTENCLEEHYQFHQKNSKINYACLGKIDWNPKMQITKEMKWSTNELLFLGKFGGHQFAFNLLQDNEPTTYNFFYTSNISLKTGILKKEKFNKDLAGYGWEDIELGYRLTKNHSLKLIYIKNALAYHHHKLELKDIVKRMESIGKASVTFDKIHPELNILPNTKKKTIFTIISNPILLKILKFISKIIPKMLPVYLYALSKKHFLIGIKEKNS